MSKRISTAAAILGVAGLFSGCNFEQPSAGCQVQDATDTPWQAAYFLKDPADAAKSCGKLTGEAIGVFKYLNPENKVSRLAIRPAGAADLVSYTRVISEDESEEVARVTDPSVATSLSASLDDEPNAQGLCSATGFVPAQVDAPEVPAGNGVEETLNAKKVSYAYDAVQVYSAPSAPGTQLQGTLRYSEGDDGEVCEYTMLALWPRVPCSVEAFNNKTPENEADACGKGSGLNPDFDAVCIAEIGPPLIEEDDDGNVISVTPRGGCVPNPKKGVPSFNVAQ